MLAMGWGQESARCPLFEKNRGGRILSCQGEVFWKQTNCSGNMRSDCPDGRSGRLLVGIVRSAILNSQSWAGDIYSDQGASGKMRRVIDTIRNSSGLLC